MKAFTFAPVGTTCSLGLSQKKSNSSATQEVMHYMSSSDTVGVWNKYRNVEVVSLFLDYI